MKNQLKYTLTKHFFKTIGLTSKGIRLCYQHGLTSGKMLDYIYENKPTGNWMVGKSLDRYFLNHPGWEAIRVRRRHLEQLLATAINNLAANQLPINILDVASGPAAYILSSITKSTYKHDIQAVCQDIDQRWLDEGQAAASAQGLTKVTYQQGNAYDLQNIIASGFNPTIIIASGFYDWVTDDNRVKESLKLNYETLADNGYFILSNQISHPDLEMVQSVFVDFDQNPLRMTMRPQNQFDTWLGDTGFTIKQCLTCPNNYFSVTLTQKVQH